MITYLIQGLLLGLSASFTPGPLHAFFFSKTLQQGWRRTLPLAFSPLLSDGPIVALVLFLLTQMPAWLLPILQIAGGLFLIYLAWAAWQAARNLPLSLDNPAAGETADSQKNLLTAAFMNLLSPGPYIFWSTVAGPAFLSGWRESAVRGLTFLFGFYGALIGGFIGLILLFGLTGRLNPRLNRTLAIVSAVALLAFALYQLKEGIQTIVTGTPIRPEQVNCQPADLPERVNYPSPPPAFEEVDRFFEEITVSHAAINYTDVSLTYQSITCLTVVLEDEAAAQRAFANACQTLEAEPAVPAPAVGEEACLAGEGVRTLYFRRNEVIVMIQADLDGSGIERAAEAVDGRLE
jgi:threonine/homoserine/homoserine lactone efflux protein